MQGVKRIVVGLLLSACSQTSAPPPAASQADSGPRSHASVPGSAPSASASAWVPTGPAAKVGTPAPDFTLPDLEGREVKLSSFVGKRVVLEWFNPECPFVKASHEKGSLKGYADRAMAKGVVWLAVNSGAAGKQGHGVDKNKAGVERFGLKHPVLLDEKGTVGRLYGATNTPHMFVIDEKGVLVYAGAIDNSPDGEGESPDGDKLVHYVADALAALDGGTPVAVPSTRAYGCSVKY